VCVCVCEIELQSECKDHRAGRKGSKGMSQKLSHPQSHTPVFASPPGDAAKASMGRTAKDSGGTASDTMPAAESLCGICRAASGRPPTLLCAHAGASNLKNKPRRE